MNPLIIIPTYVSARSKGSTTMVTGTYDHVTMLSEAGELPRLLESLVDVEGVGSTAIMVVSEQNIAAQAAEKVQVIASRYPELNIMVIGQDELSLFQQRMEQLGIGRMQKEIGLSGYSAVKNFGLLVAAALNFDSVVFLDDDEVVEDPAFLRNAVYGLGKLTRRGIPILAKTGFFYDENDNPYSSAPSKWYHAGWDLGKAFNQWMTTALNGPRLSRSNSVCGGCLAIHREAFRRVAFDPWISRGEDLDYLLNLRMYGSDMWFDNRWNLLHMPPKASLGEGQRFKQDVYRWLYEYRKLEFSRAQIDLMQIKTDGMDPYPGPFLEGGIAKRLRRTARLRGLANAAERPAYFAAAKAVKAEAGNYAERNCGHYFDFQRIWPEIVNRLLNDQVIATAFAQTNANRQAADSAFARSIDGRMFGTQTPAAAAVLDPGATGEINLNLGE